MYIHIYGVKISGRDSIANESVGQKEKKKNRREENEKKPKI